MRYDRIGWGQAHEVEVAVVAQLESVCPQDPLEVVPATSNRLRSSSISRSSRVALEGP